MFCGCGLLGVAYSILFTASRGKPLLLLAESVFFLIYILLSAILLASIGYRLHIAHEVKKPKFGIFELLLVSALFALPFAFANWIFGLFVAVYLDIESEKLGIIALISVGALFLQYPILLVAEATLSLTPEWFTCWVQRRFQRHRS